MSFLNELKRTANYTTTENGAGALTSTSNPVLDAFGSLGAMRGCSEEDIITIFSKAFNYDRKLAMRLMFYTRDIRGGVGERRVFRIMLKWLANEHSEYVITNLDNILYYGRGDDYLCLFDTPIANQVIMYLNSQLRKDWSNYQSVGEQVSLLAKWMPSINSSSKQTRAYALQFIKTSKMTARFYRKTLSALRSHLRVVERDMSANKWDEINYENLPAKAAMIYSNAFYKHAPIEYSNYLYDVAKGKAKVNAASLFPVDIVSKALKNYKPAPKDKILLDAMWQALPNYLASRKENAICMVDTSGSMSGTPLEVALSLGLYCADKSTGPFKGHFITFSNKPALVEVTGNNIFDKVANIGEINCANTDIESAFELILTTAVRNGCRQEDLPRKLYIISDMQFDEARGAASHWWGTQRVNSSLTFMDEMRERFERAGYTMPAIVYWNVRASKCGMFQDTVDGQNVAMISGYSASLFEAVIKGTTYETVEKDGRTYVKETINPLSVMMNTLMDERYDRVRS